jgi:hypothetical protein
VSLTIDPALKPQALAPLFKRLGRLHLPGFLAGDGAPRVHAALAGDVPWRKALLHGDQHYEPTLADYHAVAPDAAQAIDQAVLAQARAGFA